MTDASSSLLSVVSSIPEKDVESKLWVEKYKPLTLKQIIGQTGEKSNVNKLLNWLKSWYSNHGIGVNKKLTRPSELYYKCRNIFYCSIIKYF